MSVTSLKVPAGQETALADANRETKTLKVKITTLVNDGAVFPTLTEVNKLLATPDPTGVYRELACTTARAKSVELTQLLTHLESSAAHLVALVHSLGDELNTEDTLQAVAKDVTTSCEAYAAKTRAALCALAAAAGGAMAAAVAASAANPAATGAPAPAAVSHRVESNKFCKISSLAEPTTLPRDVSPAAFSLWLLNFTTFSDASWIPGPPTSGEKIRQLKVYLGSVWQDVPAFINKMDRTKWPLKRIVRGDSVPS